MLDLIPPAPLKSLIPSKRSVPLPKPALACQERSLPPSLLRSALCLAAAVPGTGWSPSTANLQHLQAQAAQPSCGSALCPPLYPPEVVPRRDGGFCRLVIQPAKRIVRITFRRGFIKITVPFNLNSYHTTLKRERQGELFKLSSIKVSSKFVRPLGRLSPGARSSCTSGQTRGHTLLPGLSLGV